MDNCGGKVSSEDFRRFSSENPAEEGPALLAFSRTAKEFALPTTSGYRVGAAAIGESGTIYLGANLEFPGAPPQFCVHAEQTAIAAAFAAGERKIQAMGVSEIPCGYCLQFLTEIRGFESIGFFTPNRSFKLGEALPKNFGLDNNSGNLLGRCEESLEEIEESGADLEEIVERAARASFAPYFNSVAGCAMKFKTGKVVGGCAIENAAMNPGLSPLRVAAARTLFLHESFGDIEKIVVAQCESSIINYAKEAEFINDLLFAAEFESFVF